MSKSESKHTFIMDVTFAHEDEGTAEVSPSTVASVMKNVKETFPGVVTAYTLVRSL